MLGFIIDNIASIAVGSVVLIIASFALYYTCRASKSSRCGLGCAGCSGCGKINQQGGSEDN